MTCAGDLHRLLELLERRPTLKTCTDLLQGGSLTPRLLTTAANRERAFRKHSWALLGRFDTTAFWRDLRWRPTHTRFGTFGVGTYTGKPAAALGTGRHLQADFWELCRLWPRGRSATGALQNQGTCYLCSVNRNLDNTPASLRARTFQYLRTTRISKASWRTFCHSRMPIAIRHS